DPWALIRSQIPASVSIKRLPEFNETDAQILERESLADTDEGVEEVFDLIEFRHGIRDLRAPSPHRNASSISSTPMTVTPLLTAISTASCSARIAVPGRPCDLA